MKTSRQVELEQAAAIRAWLKSLPAAERAAAEKRISIGADSHRKDSAAESDTDASWLASALVERTSSLAASTFAEAIKALSIAKAPGIDSLCTCIYLRQPGACSKEVAARVFSISPASVVQRGRRFSARFELAATDFAALELLLFISTRPRPRMTVHALLRAMGATDALALEAIGQIAGVKKQDVHKEEKLIRARFGLRPTPRQRPAAVCEKLRLTNYRPSTVHA